MGALACTIIITVFGVKEDKMSADMNTLKLEQRSCSDAVRSKEAELYKVQVRYFMPLPPLSKRLA